MPVVDAPPSDYERSASPEETRGSDRPGPSKRPRPTVHDAQRRQLEKLLANPDKEIKLPAEMAARIGGVRAPKEIIKSVSGSASAAGSGEFHVYKHSRRREAERIRHMEETNRALEEQKAFVARQAERDAVTDAKTAKNRAKRLKRKAGRKGGGGADGDRPKGAAAEVGGGSKLAGGGGGIAFRRPGDEGSDSEDGPPISTNLQAPAPSAASVADPNAATAEVEISIVDED